MYLSMYQKESVHSETIFYLTDVWFSAENGICKAFLNKKWIYCLKEVNIPWRFIKITISQSALLHCRFIIWRVQYGKQYDGLWPP